MDDPVPVLQITECIQGCHSHFAANVLRYRRFEMLQQLVKAGGHQLHADPHIAGGDEAAQADHNLSTVMRLEDHVHVHHNPFGLLRVSRSSHLLAGNDLPRLLVAHLYNMAAGAVAQITQRFQIPNWRGIALPVDAEHSRLLHNLLQLLFVLVLRRLGKGAGKFESGPRQRRSVKVDGAGRRCLTPSRHQRRWGGWRNGADAGIGRGGVHQGEAERGPRPGRPRGERAARCGGRTEGAGLVRGGKLEEFHPGLEILGAAHHSRRCVKRGGDRVYNCRGGGAVSGLGVRGAPNRQVTIGKSERLIVRINTFQFCHNLFPHISFWKMSVVWFSSRMNWQNAAQTVPAVFVNVRGNFLTLIQTYSYICQLQVELYTFGDRVIHLGLDILKQCSENCNFSLKILLIFHNPFRLSFVSSVVSPDKKNFENHFYPLLKIEIINSNNVIFLKNHYKCVYSLQKPGRRYICMEIFISLFVSADLGLFHSTLHGISPASHQQQGKPLQTKVTVPSIILIVK